MMGTGTGILCVLGYVLSLLTLSRGKLDCGSDEESVSTIGSSQYRTPGFPFSSFSRRSGYENNMFCTVTFEARYDEDGVKITILETDMPGRSYELGSCGTDRVTFYDGDSPNSPVLAIVCGKETRTISSTGHTILMVFESGRQSNGRFKGMKLSYTGIDRGGFDEHSTEVPVVVVAACVAGGVVVLIIFVIVCIAYQRKRAQRGSVIQQNQRMTTQCYNVQQSRPQQGYPPPGQGGYAPGPPMGYTPAPNTGYAPAPNTGYAPAPNTGYAPAPMGGYTPGYQPVPSTQGYTPGPPTQGYTPAQNQPYPVQPYPPMEVSQPLLTHSAPGAAGVQPSAPPPYDDIVPGPYNKPPLPS